MLKLFKRLKQKRLAEEKELIEEDKSDRKILHLSMDSSLIEWFQKRAIEELEEQKKGGENAK